MWFTDLGQSTSTQQKNPQMDNTYIQSLELLEAF